MSISNITLEYSASEQTLATWGFTDPVLTLTSQSKGTFTVRAPGSDLTAALAIPDGGAVIVRDAPAGNIIFQGKRRMRRGRAVPGDSADLITFVDAWHELEILPFQQLWTYYPIGGGSSTTKRNSRLNLFYNATTGALKTNGATIEEIINYAILKGVNLQLGSVTPAFNLPVYPTRSIMCSEAILMCLRPCPDAQTWIDYTTTPPTFNCQQRADLTPITLPYASSNHKSSEITPRYDLQVTEVVIDYQKTNSITSGSDTVLWNTYATDAYPPGSTGAIGSLVMPIDLRGAQIKSAILKAGAFDPDTTAWWKTKKRDLLEAGDTPAGNARSVTVIGSVAGGEVTVKDDSGADINLTDFPNELLDGVVASWMRAGSTAIEVVEATVTANLSWYEVTTSSGGNISTRKFDQHQVSVKVKLTNSAIGSVEYQTVSAFDETAPEDLAVDIYDSLQDLQHEGTHTIIETNVSAIHSPAELLNLSGGATEWATMNASIQSVRHAFFYGETEIEFGPAKHIQPGELAELLIWARYRQVLEDPSVQKTGLVSGSNNQVELGKNTPKENTTEGLPIAQQTTEAHDLGGMPAKTGMIVKNASDLTVQMHKATTSTGVRVDADGYMELNLGDLLGSDGERHAVKFREVDTCESGTPMKRIVACSEAF